MASGFIIPVIAVKLPRFVTEITQLLFSIEKEGFSALKSTPVHSRDYKMLKKWVHERKSGKNNEVKLNKNYEAFILKHLTVFSVGLCKSKRSA